MLHESSDGTRFATSADGFAWKPQGILASLSRHDEDRFGHVTPFLLLEANDTASLFVGGARSTSWDENIVFRIVLNKAKVDVLRIR